MNNQIIAVYEDSLVEESLIRCPKGVLLSAYVIFSYLRFGIGLAKNQLANLVAPIDSCYILNPNLNFKDH